MTANQPNSSRWYVIYPDSFFSCTAVGYLVYSLAMFLPGKQVVLYSSYLSPGYKNLLFCAIAGGFYTWIVAGKRQKGTYNADRAHAIFFGIIRIWLAAAISIYGFAKILGVQFKGADEIILRDSLLGDISGNYLTWYYFNFSPNFTLLIGYLQVAGAILLLFRRTTLAGIFVLLPLMVNIVLIDFFYGIPRIPTLLAAVFTAALFYLLLLHWQQLAALFSRTVDALPRILSPTLKNILRAAAIAFAFMSIYHEVLKQRRPSYPDNAALLGKWKVTTSSVNGKEIVPNAWQADSSRWTAIYFFNTTYCAISPNPYYFDRTKSRFAKYAFNKARHLLSIYFLRTSDSLKASIDFVSASTILVKGSLDSDSVHMQLTKVKM